MSTERLFFRRENRITSTRQFSFLFSRAKKIFCGNFSFYVHVNNTALARLGVVVAKRNQKKAVHRSRIKRIIRECFRSKQVTLVGLDIIVVVRRGVEKISASELRLELISKLNGIGGIAKKAEG